MRGISAYQNVSLESSDQRKLVVMCFEALLRRQTAAIEAIDSGKHREASEHMRVAREIFGELLLGLDHEAAPEMSTNLGGLYHFCIQELAKVGQDDGSERLQETLQITKQLHEGFATAFNGS